MFLREIHPSKALYPILVTESGMWMLMRELQPEKALTPILVTLSGISILLSEQQCKYLQPIITQYFIDNKSEIWLLFLIAHSKR